MHSARGFCATSAPDDSLMAEHRRLSVLEAKHDSTVDENRETVDPIEIETWFHIVSGKADAGLVSDEMITAQLSRLQKAYESATISYRLKGVTRQINDTWARNGDDLAMNNALRRGGYSTLNVYFQTDLQASPGAGIRGIYDIHNGLAHALNQSPTSVLGFCSLPDPKINSSSPRASYVKDGCNVLAKTMPDGPLAHYNRGGTAVHEIGH